MKCNVIQGNVMDCNGMCYVMHACMHACMHAIMHVCIVCVHINVCMCACMYVYVKLVYTITKFNKFWTCQMDIDKLFSVPPDPHLQLSLAPVLVGFSVKLSVSTVPLQWIISSQLMSCDVPVASGRAPQLANEKPSPR